jgi:uncharacterized membrane protein
VFLVTILAVFIFAALVMAVAGFFMVLGLRRRVEDLERRISARAMQSGPEYANPRTEGLPAPDSPSPWVMPPQSAPDAPAPEAEPVAKGAAPVAASSAPQSPIMAEPVAARASVSNVPIGAQAPVGPDLFARLAKWLIANWVLAVAGVSLALAGIFFVQYGIEHGLLSPAARVLAGIAFGFALIGAGVYLYRREQAGDTPDLRIPSALVGAGLVSIFAATLAARHLYGLIGPEVALIGHVLTALVAIGFGWIMGPILVALGLCGGFAAPFIVGGNSDNLSGLYAYFLVLAAFGLGVDYLRKWRWLSGLAMTLGFAGLWLVSLPFGAGLADLGYMLLAAMGLGMDYLRQWKWLSVMALGYGYLGAATIGAGQGGEGGWIAALLALLALAIIIPAGRWVPRLSAPSLTQTILQGGAKPAFAALLAMGANAVTSFILFAIAAQSAQPAAMIILGALALILPVWLHRSEGHGDAIFPPILAALAVLAVELGHSTALARQFFVPRLPEDTPSLVVSLLMLGAAAVGILLVQMARRAGSLAAIHALAGAGLLPLATLLVAFGFHPDTQLGPYPWALHIILAAGLSVWFAAQFRRVGQVRAMAWASLGALSLIALALFTVASGPALTLALAALILAAAALDRRFDMREMVLFGQLALAVVSYRLLADPGISWALKADLGQMILAYAGVLAPIWLAMGQSIGQRAGHHMVLQTALLALGATFADILILRALDSSALEIDGLRLSLLALPWLVLALSEASRGAAAGPFAKVHHIVAGIAGTLAAALLIMATLNSPLKGGRVVGPFLLDSAFAAYAIPAALLAAATWALRALPMLLRKGLFAVAGGLAALYVIIEIRRFWNGDVIYSAPVLQPELYTYTLALMLLGAGLIRLAIAQQSETIRRLGMAVIGLTIAKVFFWDAAGLSGLMRVASFAGLGLSLLALAQLNRWAAGKTGEAQHPSDP